MREKFERLMKEKLEHASIVLSQKQMDQCYQYYELLKEWNQAMNLTAIIELDDVVTKHFVDSLTVVRWINKLSEQETRSDCKGRRLRILDMGTGAGFPGIPINICFPHHEMVLMDSLNKRIRFLKEVIEQLELEHIVAVHGRAEDFGRDASYREQFDLCVSRAVANLSTLSEYCLPFVKQGGYLIAYKSEKAEKEIQESKGALKLLGGRIEETEELILPGSDIRRTLIKIRKTERTSGKYPRKAGLPGREPLK